MSIDAIRELKLSSGEWCIDATFGAGGHSALLLKNGVKVLAFDFDQLAIDQGQAHFKKEIKAGNLILVRENFNQLRAVVNQLIEQKKIDQISGVLFDFGTSTDQLMDSDRGFSFDGEGELDMRLDDRLGVTAADLLAVLSLNDLIYVLKVFGGEREAKGIANAVIRQRKESPIKTTKQLSDLVSRVKREKTKLHPATKVFQALRIIVNDEIANIELGLPQAIELVKKGGRVVTIAFHEGEDRAAKKLFKQMQDEKQGQLIYKKPLLPSELEIKSNPRARSAKMRVFEKNEN